MSQAQPLPTPQRRRSLRAWLATVGLLGVTVGGAFVWSAPREDVAIPGPDATPEQVVMAYLEAVNARDFDTANAIDARPGSDLGRVSRPVRADHVRIVRTLGASTSAQVLFTADFHGGDGTLEGDDSSWGYLLDRGSDGLWHITDAGVA